MTPTPMTNDTATTPVHDVELCDVEVCIVGAGPHGLADADCAPVPPPPPTTEKGATR